MFDFDRVQTEDGFYDIDISDVLKTDFCNLPEGITLRFSVNQKQDCFISAEGNFIVVQIELALPNERANKRLAEDADDRLMKAIKNLGTQKTLMAEESIYFNGGMKVFYWSYREPKTIQALQLCKNVISESNSILGIANNILK